MSEKSRKEYNREYARKWRAANPDKAKRNSRKWWATHPGYRLPNRVEVCRRYIEQNPEKVKESRKKYAQANPEKRRLWYHNRRARTAGNGGTYTHEELSALFEKQNGRCLYCGELLYASFDKQIHIDHKIPISRGGSNYIENIALSCADCNTRKFNKTAEEFLNA
jgi:5-methylcytosine-specific restriction endonuclease McrA